LALDGADIRQWISSQIPAKHKKCGLDATEELKSPQNAPAKSYSLSTNYPILLIMKMFELIRTQ
jgi:hypothetical protein